MDAAVMYAPGLKYVSEEFLDAADRLGLSTQADEQSLGPFASISWWIPTAVVLFLSRKYFETIAAEAAKDQYPVIRRALMSLFRRLAGRDREVKVLPMVSTSSPMKITASEMDGLSIYGVLCSGQRITFVVGYDLADSEHSAAIDALHQQMVSHYRECPADNFTRCIEEAGQMNARQLFARYDSIGRLWVVVVAKTRDNA